jgi:translation initiation factor IF-2
LKVPYNISLE